MKMTVGLWGGGAITAAHFAPPPLNTPLHLTSEISTSVASCTSGSVCLLERLLRLVFLTVRGCRPGELRDQIYSWCHENGSFNSFNQLYLSIPRYTWSWGNRFQETYVIEYIVSISDDTHTHKCLFFSGQTTIRRG